MLSFFVDIVEAIGNIKDKKTRDAVLRNLEVRGEAVKNIPDEIKEKYSEVNWKAIAGMRDKLTHEYFGLATK